MYTNIYIVHVYKHNSLYESITQISRAMEKMNREDTEPSRQFLGSNDLLTGLVLGYGDSTIEQVKMYTKLREVSNKFKSIIDKNMTQKCEENFPPWLKPFHTAHIIASKTYFRDKLCPVKNTDETTEDFNIRRKPLWSEAFLMMENVYFYPQASSKFFLYLDRFMQNDQNIEWAFGWFGLNASFPEMVEGFLPRILFYMQVCAKDSRIQKLGCQVITCLEGHEHYKGRFNFVSITMWTRMIDILEKHKKNSCVVMKVLWLCRMKQDILQEKHSNGFESDIQKPTFASYKTVLIDFALELEDVIKVYENPDIVITLDVFDYRDTSKDITQRNILRYARTLLNDVNTKIAQNQMR